MAVYPWKGAYVVVSDHGDGAVYPTLEAEEVAGMLRAFDDGDYRGEVNREPHAPAPGEARFRPAAP